MLRSSIRSRLLASLLVVALIAAGALSVYFLKELEAFALRKLEERLSAEAQVTSALLGSVYQETGASPGSGGAVEPRVLDRALQKVSPKIASRIRVIDARGRVVADSYTSKPTSEDYRRRREIDDALHDRYGAATRLLPDGHVALYVTAPIKTRGRIVGATYASSTTFSIITLLRNYREKLVIVVVAFMLTMLLLTEVFSRWLSAPLRELAAGASALAQGNMSVRVTPRGAQETRDVADAFNRMAAEVDAVMTELRAEERRKTRFVSDVSHELRTPLTAIRGAAETLLDGDVDQADAERFLSTIVRESDRLARLANDLLSLQRIEGATGELPLRRIDLAEIASRAVGALAPLLDERGIRVKVSGESAKVLGDPDRLQQVVANLVDNASRVSAPGSTVRLELQREGRDVGLSVLDDGPGIPDDALPHLFERFFRAQPSRDRSTGGAGLGLSIAKAIVEAHAGRIEVSNRAEGGCRFTVWLPMIEPDAPSEAAS